MQSGEKSGKRKAAGSKGGVAATWPRVDRTGSFVQRLGGKPHHLNCGDRLLDLATAIGTRFVLAFAWIVALYSSHFAAVANLATHAEETAN